jgi:hypothetical protein
MQDGLVSIIHLATWDLLASISTIRAELYMGAERLRPPMYTSFKHYTAQPACKTYPSIRKCLLLLGPLHKKQFSFIVEHDCASTYHVNALMLAKVFTLRYCELLQGGRVVERRD